MHLSNSDWAHVEERAQDFTGRGWVFMRVRTFFASDARMLVIVAPPGTGKTAIAGRLAQASEGRLPDEPVLPVPPGTLAAAVFCRASQVSLLEVAQSLADQLAAALPGFAEEQLSTLAPQLTISAVHVQTADVATGANVAGVPVDLARLGPERAFADGLALPLKRLGETPGFRAPVLLVDSLDEAYGSGLAAELPRLLTNLVGARLILTTRDDPLVLAQLPRREDRGTGVEWIDLVDDAPRGVDDILDFVRAELEGRGPVGPLATLAGRIAVAADGIFLYARYVLDALGPDTLANLDEAGARAVPLPVGGLPGIYRDFIGRLIGAALERWRTHVRPVLGPLAVARGEGLTAQQLVAIVAQRAVRPPSPDEVHDVLADVGQFLEGPRRDGPFRVYHRSFAEFLLDARENPDWPIDASEANAAIVDALTPRDAAGSADWSAADPDDYGLRHVVFHELQSNRDSAGQLDDVITPEFLTAKTLRLGIPPVLDDLRLAIQAAAATGDLARLLRWTWLYVSVREQASHLVMPELLPLRVRLGDYAGTLDLIDELDAQGEGYTDERDGARRHMAIALAKQGMIEAGLAVARTIEGESQGRDRLRGETLNAIALHVASLDKAKALEIISEAGSTAGPEICRVLASDPAFLDHALELAAGMPAAVEAIAVEIAGYDLDQALAILEQMPPYNEDAAGERRPRTADKAKATIAARLVPQRYADAMRIFGNIADETERRRAVIGIAGAMASADPRGALIFVSGQPDLGATTLALAHGFLIAGTSDRASKLGALAALRKRRGDAAGNADDLSSSLDLVCRLDLEAVRRDDLAAPIAADALRVLEERLRPRLKYFKYPLPLARAIGAALAVFDLDQALAFFARVSGYLPIGIDWSDAEAIFAIIRVVARRDALAAVDLLPRTTGIQHYAYLAIVEEVAQYDFEKATEIVDGVDARYARTRAAMLGVLAGQVGPDDEARARSLLAKGPRLVDSEAFKSPFLRTMLAVAVELGNIDVEGSAALLQEVWQRADAYPQILLECTYRKVVATARDDPTGALILTRGMDPGLEKGRAFKAVAAHLTDATATGVLREAIGAFSSALDGAPELQRDIVEALASSNPWAAMERVLARSIGPRVALATMPTIVAKLRADEVDGFLEKLVGAIQSDMDRYWGLYSERTRLLLRVLDLFDEDGRSEALRIVEATDPQLAQILTALILADSHPDRALAALEQAGVAEDWWLEVAYRAMRRRPSEAVALVRRRGGKAVHQTIADLTGVAAESDPTAALSMIETEPWESEHDRSSALGNVAVAVASRDWDKASRIADQIPQAAQRANVWRRMLRVVPAAMWADSGPMILDGMATEARALPQSESRGSLYRALVDAADRLDAVPPDLIAALVRDLALGDRETFAYLLPRLATLICQQHSSMPARLEAELRNIERLLSQSLQPTVKPEPAETVSPWPNVTAGQD